MTDINKEADKKETEIVTRVKFKKAARPVAIAAKIQKNRKKDFLRMKIKGLQTIDENNQS